jgi:GxxExxY protein
MTLTQKNVNDVAYKIVGCAIEVHKHIGPGLLESIYKECFVEELRTEGLTVATELSVPLFYKQKKLVNGLRLDILVNDIIIVEVKAVEQMIPLYHAQLLSYLKMTMKPKGLLINFNCTNITKQLVPLVTEEFSKLPID